MAIISIKLTYIRENVIATSFHQTSDYSRKTLRRKTERKTVLRGKSRYTLGKRHYGDFDAGEKLHDRFVPRSALVVDFSPLLFIGFSVTIFFLI